MTRFVGAMRTNGRWLIAALAAAMLAGVWGGAALALTPAYSVHITMPSQVVAQTNFMVTMSGRSTTNSALFLYYNPARSCALTPAGESGRGAKVIAPRIVMHKYKVVSRPFRATLLGKHHFCAYLEPPGQNRVRARATASFTVVKPPLPPKM